MVLGLILTPTTATPKGCLVNLICTIYETKSPETKCSDVAEKLSFNIMKVNHEHISNI